MPYFAEGTGIPIRSINAGTASASASSEPQVPDRVRIKNRRKRYLDTHPEYFGPQLELADPLMYDRLVRRFQTAAEREAEGRQKGYSGILEADIYRSEAKLDALRNPDPNSMFTYKRGPNGEIFAEEQDEVPANQEEGLGRWRWEMETRFLRGGDEDFDYGTVDKNPDYDDRMTEERDAEDRYFEAEEPEFVDDHEGATKRKSTELQGETGVQDF
ncbi:coiled-coil domain-containing protein-domain-containing protein [Exophiala viscosa]|uniref:Coiled-coil domain-containing protein-domain-containing protein n=1 Tax=Exophiala viscosa TaxID=2486360 RepID=A0AAN6DW62_9EURO|nr:coiled-coil domain-containing protein-domain-containing protein [Exophiala viscosa]